MDHIGGAGCMMADVSYILLAACIVALCTSLIHCVAILVFTVIQ
mgnify:CR=1 FL=1